MIIEHGVEMSGLCLNMTKVLKIIDLVFYENHSHMVITATSWGKDNHRRSHESGKAIDVIAPLVNRLDIFYKLKSTLGLNYVVRDKKEHFHICFAPLREIPKK